jgi:hypothetical protein
MAVLSGRSWYWLSLSMSILLVACRRFSFAQPTNYSCNVSADECPSKYDEVCDSNLGPNPLPGCETGDCFDCDLCT